MARLAVWNGHCGRYARLNGRREHAQSTLLRQADNEYVPIRTRHERNFIYSSSL